MATLKEYIKSDLLKVRECANTRCFLSALFFNSSFKRILVYRLCQRQKNRAWKTVWGGVNRILSRRYSVYISSSAQIGTGLLLPHCFSIMISTSKIGNNVTILQQVTIGSQRGGKHPGFPTIGDNVFIACGAKVLGGIKVGNNVVIGANAVVIRDVPDNAVVGGVPAKILNYEGERHVKNWCKDLRDYHKS